MPETSCYTRHEPRGEAGSARGRRPQRRLQPVRRLLDGRVGLAGPFLRRGGRLLHRPVGPAREPIVAWDNLSQPAPGTNDGNFPPGEAGCPAHPEDRTPGTDNKPALGMSADYFLPPTPNTPSRAARASAPPGRRYERASRRRRRVDRVQGAGSLRTPGAASTPARSSSAAARTWTSRSSPTRPSAPRCAAPTCRLVHDRLVRQVRQARPDRRRRLLTNRWRHDAAEAAVDPNGDGNMFSFYHRSRLDITRCRRDEGRLRGPAGGLRARSPTTTATLASTPTRTSTARPTASRSRSAARSPRCGSR